MTYGFFGLGPVERLYMRDHPLFSSSQEEMLEKLSTLPLVEQPGTKWRYSVSTDVLGALVERVSGQSLGEFFQEHIFLPLSMEDTGFVVPDEKLDRFASVYGLNLTLLDAARSSAYRQSDRLQSGGGGLVSTASDYHRFCQMLLDGGVFDGRRLLKEETVEEMMRNQLPEGVRAYRLFGFGLGLQVQMTDWGVLAHRDQVGWNGVASTHFWISPRDDLIFIALSQRQPYSTQLKDVLTPLVYGALEP
jgi:CubicO group peptidase (beta-lactamase class C family)